MTEKNKQPEKTRLKTLEKQKLHDLEHKISANVGNFLVLLEEGSAEAIKHARNKARSDLLKWGGGELQQISQTLGGTSPEFIDDATVRGCFAATRKLEKMLK